MVYSQLLRFFKCVRTMFERRSNGLRILSAFISSINTICVQSFPTPRRLQQPVPSVLREGVDGLAFVNHQSSAVCFSFALLQKLSPVTSPFPSQLATILTLHIAPSVGHALSSNLNNSFEYSEIVL